MSDAPDIRWSVAEAVGAIRELCPAKEPDVVTEIVTPDGRHYRLDRIVTDGERLFLVVGGSEPPTRERAAAVRAGLAAYERLEAELEAQLLPGDGERVEYW